MSRLPRTVPVPNCWRVLDTRHRPWRLDADLDPISGVAMITITNPQDPDPVKFTGDHATDIVGAFLEAKARGVVAVLGDEPGVSVLRTAFSLARVRLGAPIVTPTPVAPVVFVPGLALGGEVARDA